MKLRSGRRAPVLVDMTPMIDVVFQLLLFFLVSTQFITRPAIQVDLPRASSEQIIASEEDVNVWVTRSGLLFLNDEELDLAGLRTAFVDAYAENPSSLVVIRADLGVSHGDVVGVMDAARDAGLERLAIATDQRAQPESP